MTKRDPLAYIEDILQYAEKAFTFAKGLDEQAFLADERTSFAVIRCFEVIGEAANRVPKELQDRFSEIPWPKVVSFRNFLIHEYLGVSLQRVWASLNSDLPNTLPAFKKMLETLQEEEKNRGHQ